MPPVPGVRFATAPAGIKYKDRDDVMLAVLAPGTVVAGVFTTSATCSAAVLDCRAKLGKPNSGPAAIVVNSGNANAFTGRAGQNSVDHICKAVAGVLDLPSDRVFTASTGVIGEILPHDKIIATVPALSDALSPDGLHHAAQAIRTTDTFAKGASVSVDIHGTPITISGIAKGSGMIAPDMATMLAYVFTDAQLDHTALQ
ncbi:MAG: bifunctional ornithine acetyltransferase/N-acetylglutamate synthase, partial [Pseudomonadota bacterium]